MKKVILGLLLAAFFTTPSFSQEDIPEAEKKEFDNLPEELVATFEVPLRCGKTSYWLKTYETVIGSEPIWYGLSKSGPQNSIFQEGGVFSLYASEKYDKWVLVFRPQIMPKIVCMSGLGDEWFSQKHFYTPETQEQ